MGGLESYVKIRITDMLCKETDDMSKRMNNIIVNVEKQGLVLAGINYVCVYTNLVYIRLTRQKYIAINREKS